MRRLLILCLIPAILAAEEPKKGPESIKESPRRGGPALQVGDAAPALVATKWLQGAEVKGFVAGKVTVVEFWATWCGPCIVMMPHMADLQRQYRDKGVTFVGYSANDANNTAEKVATFVAKRGPKLGYTFAYAEDRTTYSAWMTAAERRGIPCSFVVDQAGKLAYIGHPMYLDLVLPKIVAGTWKVDEDNAALEKAEKEVTGVFKALNGTDSAAGLKALTTFETAHPELNHIPYFVGPRLNLMLKSKQFDEAKKVGEAVLARAVKEEDPMLLRTVSSMLRGPQARDNKDLLALSLQAAEAGLKVAGEGDSLALLDVAEAHFAAGDKVRAKDYGAKALAASEKDGDGQRAYIERQVRKFE
jgi:thiol-disulfide isomerase/thioredoxin